MWRGGDRGKEHHPLQQPQRKALGAYCGRRPPLKTHLQGSFDSPFLYSWMALALSLPLRCSLEGTRKKDTLRHSGQVRLMSFCGPLLLRQVRRQSVPRRSKQFATIRSASTPGVVPPEKQAR